VCRTGFDVVEVSSGFITIPTDDWIGSSKVQRAGLKQNQRWEFKFGAAAQARHRRWKRMELLSQMRLIAQGFLDAGASLIMIESEGITET